MGRPPKVIDEILVFKLASYHCSMEEIADACECSVDTLERRFADVIRKGKSSSKRKLRKMQFRLAMKGNVVMCIFLGKQLLGQSDKVQEIIDPELARQKDLIARARLLSPQEIIKLIQDQLDSKSNTP